MLLLFYLSIKGGPKKLSNQIEIEKCPNCGQKL
ncbi:unnamed protein product, partial [marine sediment metagenome]